MDWMFENKKEFVHSSDYADSRIFGAEELSDNIMKFANNELLNKLANAYNAVPTTNGFTLLAKLQLADMNMVQEVHGIEIVIFANSNHCCT